MYRIILIDAIKGSYQICLGCDRIKAACKEYNILRWTGESYKSELHRTLGITNEKTQVYTGWMKTQTQVPSQWNKVCRQQSTPASSVLSGTVATRHMWLFKIKIIMIK